MTSLLDLLVPNFMPTLWGIVSIVVGALILYVVTKVPDKFPGSELVKGFGSVVSVGLFIFGLILIFVVSILSDIYKILSSNLNLSLVLIGAVLVGLLAYLLFIRDWRKKK